MNLAIGFLRSLPCFLLVFSVPVSALTPARTLSFNMDKGNLVLNWSFENSLQAWEGTPLVGFTVDPHYKYTAKSGSYVGLSDGAASDAGVKSRIQSGMMPIKAGYPYTLSFVYQASNVVGQNWPVVQFHKDRVTKLDTLRGSNFSNNAGWKLYRFPFYANEEAAFIQLTLSQSNAQSHGGRFLFDNVILQEGYITLDAEIQAQRDSIVDALAFTDAFGRTLQTHAKSAPGKYLVNGIGYDSWGRSDTSFLATPVSQAAPAMNGNLATMANGYYTGAAGKGPDAGGFAFSEIQFPANSIGASSVSSPGAAWKLTGTHTNKQGFYFSSSLSFLPANIESPATDAQDRDYRVDWTRDADSNYAFTWSNRVGQIVQKANNLTRGGSSASAWTLSRTQYEYYPNGALKRVRTPIDAQENNVTYSEISEFNSLGQIFSNYSKNAGLTRYWYNRNGNLRFMQDSGLKVLGAFRFSEYDGQGRVLSEGIQYLSQVTQDLADRDFVTEGRSEQVGYIYDDLSTFEARTGYPLTELMPYSYLLSGRNTNGRLVCAYNRNGYTSVGGISERDRFVLDFYDYDSRGNVSRTLKAIHPIRDPNRKFQDAYFNYDENNRIVESFNYLDAASSSLATRHKYIYDAQGRLSKVWGLADKPLAQFTYTDHGTVKQVLLGGDGTGTKGTRIEYIQNVRGWISEIRATDLLNAKVVYQEFLGYNDKSNPASTVPGQPKPLFNGKLTQRLYRFAKDVELLSPVRMVNYDYDNLGRLLRADYSKNSNSQPFYSDGTVNFPVLGWTNTLEQDSYLAYDLNGRITGQRTGGVSSLDSARYVYKPGTYKLDRIDGKLSNAISRPLTSGTLVYNDFGQVYYDGSKSLEIHYNWNGQAVEFDSYANGTRFQYLFYDAAGECAMKIFWDGSNYQGKAYIEMGTGISKEWHETVEPEGMTVISSQEIVNLSAHQSLGRIRGDGVYEFYLKDRLGSTMKTAAALGGEPAGGGSSYDYMPYGDLRKLKDGSQSVTEKYTGKEYEAFSRMYDFGARNYDPELGFWMSPDPAKQYFNPYCFAGGDPINRIDPDGANDCMVDNPNKCIYHCKPDGTCSKVCEKTPDLNCMAKKNAEKVKEIADAKVREQNAQLLKQIEEANYQRQQAMADKLRNRTLDELRLQTNHKTASQQYIEDGIDKLLRGGGEWMPGVYYTPFKDAGLYAEGLLDLYIGIFQAADVFPEENEALAEAPLGRQIKGLAKLPALLDAVEVARNSYLYQKIGAMGEHLKFGITKNPLTRYSSEELGGGRLRILASGSREEMLRLERNLHSTLPIGPQERQLFYIQQQVSKGLLAPPY